MSVYKPDLRWQFDWRHDGRYDHPLSDVTADVESYDVRWGSAADTPSDEILAGTAVGRLSIFDRDGRYDPDNPRLQIDETILRAPVPVRAIVGAQVVWSGRAVPQHGTSFRVTTYFDWLLEGRYAEQLRSNVTASYPAAPLSAVADPAVPVDLSESGLGLGDFVFEGARVVLFEDLARLGGGWLVEDRQGALALRNLQAAAAASPAATLTLAHRPGSDAYLAEAPTLVKTRCTLMGQTWQAAGEREVARKRVYLTANRGEQVALVGNDVFRIPETRAPQSFGGSAGRYSPHRRVDGVTSPTRISQWLAPTVAENDPGGTVTVFTPGEDPALPDPDGSSYTIKVISTESGLVTLSYRSQILTLQVVDLREIVRTDVEDVYGVQELVLQPWLDLGLEGAEQYLIPWLDNLTEPLEYFRVSYPEWQPNAGQWATLLAADAGQVVSLQLSTRWAGVRTVAGLVLAVRLTGGRGQAPVRTLYGIVPRYTPPAPLTAITARPTSTTTALVIVSNTYPGRPDAATAETYGAPPAPGDKVYARIKEQAGSAQSTAAVLEQVQFGFSGLTRDTDYTAQAATDAAFSSDLVEATFRTPLRGELISFDLPAGGWKPQYLTPGRLPNTLNVVCDDGRIRVFGSDGTLETTVDIWRLATGSSATSKLTTAVYSFAETPAAGYVLVRRAGGGTQGARAYWVEADLSAATELTLPSSPAYGNGMPLAGGYYTHRADMVDGLAIPTARGSRSGSRITLDLDNYTYEVRTAIGYPDVTSLPGGSGAFAPDYEHDQALEVIRSTELHARAYTTLTTRSTYGATVTFSFTSSQLFDLTAPTGDTTPADLAVIGQRIGIVWTNARRIAAYNRAGTEITA